MHHFKVFRCYVHSVASAITVEAQSHEEAARLAAKRMGWDVTEVVTRYVVTKISGGRPEWKERGRLTGGMSHAGSYPVALGPCVAARSSGNKSVW